MLKGCYAGEREIDLPLLSGRAVEGVGMHAEGRVAGLSGKNRFFTAAARPLQWSSRAGPSTCSCAC
jgi:hypothetical protein